MQLKCQQCIKYCYLQVWHAPKDPNLLDTSADNSNRPKRVITNSLTIYSVFILHISP